MGLPVRDTLPDAEEEALAPEPPPSGIRTIEAARELTYSVYTIADLEARAMARPRTSKPPAPFTWQKAAVAAGGAFGTALLLLGLVLVAADLTDDLQPAPARAAREPAVAVIAPPPVLAVAAPPPPVIEIIEPPRVVPKPPAPKAKAQREIFIP